MYVHFQQKLGKFQFLKVKLTTLIFVNKNFVGHWKYVVNTMQLLVTWVLCINSMTTFNLSKEMTILQKM